MRFQSDTVISVVTKSQWSQNFSAFLKVYETSTNQISCSHHELLHSRGAARIFVRGGGLKLWKQKLRKGKIACDKNSQESTYIVDKQLTVLTTKPGVLPTKLPSCFSDILSWRP